MARRSGQTNRDMFSGHGAGKGDKNRTTDERAYKANYSEINWGPLDPMFGQKVKHYGPRLPEKISVSVEDVGPMPEGWVTIRDWPKKS